MYPAQHVGGAVVPAGVHSEGEERAGAGALGEPVADVPACHERGVGGNVPGGLPGFQSGGVVAGRRAVGAQRVVVDQTEAGGFQEVVQAGPFRQRREDGETRPDPVADLLGGQRLPAADALERERQCEAGVEVAVVHLVGARQRYPAGQRDRHPQ